MGVPKQVKQQAEAAEALAVELGLVPEAEGEPVAEAPPESPTEVASVTEISDAPPVEVAAPEVTPEPTPDAKLEQKYNTLKGKYDAEMQSNKDAMDSLRGTVESQTAVLAALQAQNAAPPAPETPDEAVAAAISATEISDYGEELLDLIGRKALLSLTPTLDQLNQRLASLEQGVGGMQQKAVLSDRQKVYAALDESVTDWKTVNRSEEFKSWLLEADPYVGQQRGALLSAAFDSNATERVVAFFKGYLNEQTTVETSGSAPEPAATPVPQAAQVDLETLVSPGGAQEAAPASAHRDNAGRVYTNADIASFYSDCQKGKYKGRDSEKLAIEQDIVAAANEGRIR
jgi:hypothetical protein